jgi:hypothetical protein
LHCIEYTENHTSTQIRQLYHIYNVCLVATLPELHLILKLRTCLQSDYPDQKCCQEASKKRPIQRRRYPVASFSLSRRLTYSASITVNRASREEKEEKARKRSYFLHSIGSMFGSGGGGAQTAMHENHQFTKRQDGLVLGEKYDKTWRIKCSIVDIIQFNDEKQVNFGLHRLR